MKHFFSTDRAVIIQKADYLCKLFLSVLSSYILYIITIEPWILFIALFLFVCLIGHTISLIGSLITRKRENDLLLWRMSRLNRNHHTYFDSCLKEDET
jgi:hypothetical protein